jgi:hypothetical protein
VEAALTLPLVVFLVLGTIQLFMMLQGRIMAEYAAFRATRAASVRHGDCTAMTHAAILALLPNINSFLGRGYSGSPSEKLGQAFALRRDNRYRPGSQGDQDGQHSGPIVWIIRDGDRFQGREDSNFDEPRTTVMRQETRLVYWFALRIPFADWVISRMVLAHWGLKTYNAQNPLMLTQKANWQEIQDPGLENAIYQEMLSRADNGEYVIPIHASASLRMMTPAQGQYFRTKNCPPAPEEL